MINYPVINNIGRRQNAMSGIRYELSWKGSFTNIRPNGYTLNHVLSYRDTFDKYGMPRDVRKTIDRSINTVKKYQRDKDSDGATREYFKVLRDYYTYEGPDNPGIRQLQRYIRFIDTKAVKLVIKDLNELKKLLKTAENKPEFED